MLFLAVALAFVGADLYLVPVDAAFALAETVGLRAAVDFDLDWDRTAADAIPVRQKLRKTNKNRFGKDGLIIGRCFSLYTRAAGDCTVSNICSPECSRSIVTIGRRLVKLQSSRHL